MLFRIGAVVIFCGSLASLVGTGCSSGKKSHSLAEVKGKVDMDGKPMSQGVVMFVLLGEVPDKIEVKNGAFAGKAKIGKAKVEIRAYRPGQPNPMYPGKEPPPENYLPPQYNEKSTMTADVTQGGANDFKFEVKSK